MDNRLTPKQQDAIIEDALHSYPLADMPKNITSSVMTRIRLTSAPRSFQLTWSDLAIAFVISLCIGAVLFSLQNFPPLVLMRLRIQSILFYQDLIVNASWLVPSALFVFAAFLFALTVPYFQKQLSNK
ncbi:MAG: hypothetical protein HY863_00260 [Chloroflexi bacterium]|nr:hypothetical protein [Chloroflexota bacterium]